MDGAALQALWQSVARNDDQQSFRTLFTFFYERLVRFAADMVWPGEAAEEIVSDVFVYLWKNRKTGQDILHLKTYLYTAVRNRCLNYNRDHGRYRLDDLDTAATLPAADPGPALEWKELQHLLNEAVATLPPQCRTVFRLIREEGFSYKEAAAILHISPRTVETQLVRAIARLRTVLQHVAPAVLAR